MLKKAILAAVIIVITGATLYAQQPFNIKGQIGKEINGFVTLTLFDGDIKIKDSVQVKAGKFSFTGQVKEPSLATVMLNPTIYRPGSDQEQWISKDAQDFYLEPGNSLILSKSGIQTARISAGENQSKFSELNSKKAMLDSTLVPMEKLYRQYMAANDTGSVRQLMLKVNPILKQKAYLDSIFIVDNPNSYAAFNKFIEREGIKVIELPKVEEQFKRFSEVIRNSWSGKRFAKRTETAKKLSPGQPAIDFALPNVEGETVSLASLKGKHVLLVFWIGNMPNFNQIKSNIDQALKKVGSDKLVVLGVGFFQQREEWINTLSQRAISWLNVAEINAKIDKSTYLPFSDIPNLYDLHAFGFPRCFLIDPDGTILDGNVKADQEMANRVDQLIAKESSTAPKVQNTIRLTGTVAQPSDEYLSIFKVAGPVRTVVDSCKIQENGTYTKEFRNFMPGVYYLGFPMRQSTAFWAEKEDVRIDLPAEGPALIKGGTNNTLMNLLNELVASYQKNMSANTPGLDRRKLMQDHREQLISTIRSNSGIPAVIFALEMFDFERDAIFLRDAAARLLQANPGNQAVLNYKAETTRLNIGQPATDVTYRTLDGTKQSLKEILGHAKYTLVDFWGTYCIPCREGIPGIIKLYAGYKSKGFEVLAISLDTSEETWRKSLKEEDMPWAQARIEDGGKKVMVDYRFSFIPYLALFDQQGNIVALGLQHDELEQKLKQLMGEPDASAQVEEAGKTGSATPEEEKLINKIISAYKLEEYQQILTSSTESSYKDTLLKGLKENLSLKDYQLSKIGWSILAHYKNYRQIIQSSQSNEEKLKALIGQDRNQIGFYILVFSQPQFQEYLKLRQLKKLSF